MGAPDGSTYASDDVGLSGIYAALGDRAMRWKIW